MSLMKDRNDRYIKSKLRYDLATKSSGDVFFNLGYSQLPYWQKRSSMDRFAEKIKPGNTTKSQSVPKKRPVIFNSMN